MKKTLLISVGLLFACSMASASTWTGTSLNNSVTKLTLIKNDSIECQGKYCSAWLANVNTDERLQYDLHQMYVEVNCQKMSWRWTYSAGFYKGKQVTKTVKEKDFATIPPGTMGYIDAQYICKKHKLTDDFKGNPFEIVKPVQKQLKVLRDKYK